MSKFKPRRPSPAMAVAMCALFVALGGVGYAATVLPANSVGTNQLRTNAVTNAKIADNTITKRTMAGNSIGTPEIIPNSIIAGDLAVSAVTTGTLAARSVTNSKLGTASVTPSKVAAGAITGTKVAPLAVGAGKTKGFIVRTAAVTVQGGQGVTVVTGIATARCLTGEQAVGSGTLWSGGIADNLATVFTQIIADSKGVPNGVTARGLNLSGAPHLFTVQAICMKP